MKNKISDSGFYKAFRRICGHAPTEEMYTDSDSWAYGCLLFDRIVWTAGILYNIEKIPYSSSWDDGVYT